MHEKSILLPLLPAALLGVYYPAFAAWFGAVATFRYVMCATRDSRAPLSHTRTPTPPCAQHVPAACERWARVPVLHRSTRVPRGCDRSCHAARSYALPSSFLGGALRLPLDYTNAFLLTLVLAVVMAQGSLLLLPVVHAAAAHLPPSITARYPDMAAVLISAYSCALFVAAWLLGNSMLLRTPSTGLASRRTGEKQHAQ